MPTILNAILRQVVTQRRRLIAVTLAIAIGTAFLTATLLFGPVLEASFRNRVGAEYRYVDLIVSALDRPLTDSSIARMREVEGVAGVEPQPLVFIDATGRGSAVYLTASTVPTVPSLAAAQEMRSGRLPARAGEVALSASAARQLGAESGGTATLQVPVDAPTGIETRSRAFTVTGIYGPAGRFGDTEISVYLSPADLTLWNLLAESFDAFVIAEPGVATEDLIEPVASAAGTGAEVLTARQRIDSAVAEFESAARIQSLAVTAFAVIALIVAGVVISNTFAILVVQRTRDLALFRCLGATGRQVRRLVLGEALLIGVVGSGIGIAVSALVAQALLSLLSRTERFEILPSRIGIAPSVVIVPLLAGIVLTLGAAWSPSREATRVAPLQALRTSVAPPLPRRPGRRAVVLTLLPLAAGVLLLGVGMAISMAGMREVGVLIGLAGGTAAFLGVLIGARFVVPSAIRLAETFAGRIGGVPARVSVANSLRNPRRTTATAVALLIGVTFVSMMATGAATLRATLTGEIDATTPIDLEVSLVPGDSPSGDGLDSSFTDAAAAVDGIQAIATVSNVPVTVTAGGTEYPEVYVDAVDPVAAAAVSRNTDALADLRPGVIAVPDFYAEAYGWPDGGTVTASIGDASLPLTVAVIAFEGDPVIARGDLDRLVSAPPLTGLWIRLDDDAGAGAVMDDLYGIAERQGVRLSIGGGNEYRATLIDALNTMLYVVTGLLVAAIAIALVGIGNTLSLSIIERTRETALLRTLGFTQSQLRAMLAIEGALIAGTGGLFGIIGGAVFGWIGALTLVGDEWDVALRLPLGWLAATMAIAVLAGVLASVLPARRASRANPVVALAGTEVTA